MINLQLSKEEKLIWLEILNKDIDSIRYEDALKRFANNKKQNLDNLIRNNLLILTNNTIYVPSRYQLGSVLVREKQNKNELSTPEVLYIKEYLRSVQKQFTLFETEGKQSFLALRTMVEKIVNQGKDYVSRTFENYVISKKDTGNWINIPHVSPIGIYEPISNLKHNFQQVMNELEGSIANLITEFNNQVKFEINSIIEIIDQFENSSINTSILKDAQFKEFNLKLLKLKSHTSTIINNLVLDDQIVINEISMFNDENIIAINHQFDRLEQNLGKDLIEQFDAIEQLNELDPSRILIKIEQLKTELFIHLNSIYSRMLREINILQKSLDVSKMNITLTNEAGKLIKKLQDLQINNSIEI